MKFTVIIPTYNREKDLQELLNSIFQQTFLPDEIIIIDDGELDENFLEKIRIYFENYAIKLIYYRKDHTRERKGSSESRNIGVNLSHNEIIFILDDDLKLDFNFFQKIIELWAKNKNDEKLIGIGGWITNIRRQTSFEKVYNKIFGISSKNLWDVNEVGFQVWDMDIKEPLKGFYIHGGVSSYKKSLLKKMGGFETFQGGRTALEDVEFCLRAKKMKYFFIITPYAKAIHKQSIIGREDQFKTGFKEGHNRKIIFKKHCKQDLFHKIWFWWANIGWILRQFLSGHFSKGIGMIKGLFNSLE